MKRSRIQRKTPMRRTPKKQSLPEPADTSIRDAWSAQFDRCMLCGMKAKNCWPPRLETHEIARGPHRESALQHTSAFIRTCPRCHSERLDGMSIVTQAAIKKLMDPEHYDLVDLNLLRDRQPDAVADDEVEAEASKLRSVIAVNEYPFERWRW